jgi:hypothetical protein
MSEAEEMILLEQQARTIKGLEKELAEIRFRVKEHCGDCWAFRGRDPAQCRGCALYPYKGGAEG